MNYFVRGISAEVTPIRNVADRSTEYYLVVITDEDKIDPVTQRAKVLYTGTYKDPLDATEAAVLRTDSARRKHEKQAMRANAA